MKAELGNIFRTIGPDWRYIPNVQVSTILAVSQNDESVSFRGDGDAQKHRTLLENLLSPVQPIHWLNQKHGNTVLEYPEARDVDADGAVTSKKKIICAVRSADCLPIAFVDLKGTRVGVAHAGWKGLAGGILAQVIKRFERSPNEIAVWIGPAIAQAHYEVGPEVRQAFLVKDASYSAMFANGIGDRFFADLGAIASFQLRSLGVVAANISSSEIDTYSSDECHSSRRDGERAGRMATIAWLS